MTCSWPNPVIAPSRVLSLLDQLHEQSSAQDSALGDYLDNRADFDERMRDKFIALDQDKCHFLYQLLRAINAKNVVEVGTSFGVSTIYLALAVGSNLKASGGQGKVIATEKENTKAERARAYWTEAGDELVTNHIDLRVGDLNETLKTNVPTIDLVLLDSMFLTAC
jgi:predicted O-methyltransferase YrrM